MPKNSGFPIYARFMLSLYERLPFWPPELKQPLTPFPASWYTFHSSLSLCDIWFVFNCILTVPAHQHVSSMGKPSARRSPGGTSWGQSCLTFLSNPEGLKRPRTQHLDQQGRTLMRATGWSLKESGSLRAFTGAGGRQSMRDTLRHAFPLWSRGDT